MYLVKPAFSFILFQAGENTQTNAAVMDIFSI